MLSDSDKLDATGALGIARTLIYMGIVAEPLYCVDEDGNVLDEQEEQSSFFREYNWKLKNVYDKRYTNRAKVIAEKRRRAGIDFYENISEEVNAIHKKGLQLLNQEILLSGARTHNNCSKETAETTEGVL